MVRQAAFNSSNDWYKGNLHTHTTRSDGIHTPEETVSLYKNKDMDFLALTDHRIFSAFDNIDTKGILLIPGMEADISVSETFKTYHFVVLQADEKHGLHHGDKIESPKYESISDVQRLIDKLKAEDNHIIFCHPVWSRTELLDFIDLTGYNSMEIYNHFCTYDGNCSTSTIYWDSLLRRGKNIYGTATDDFHENSWLIGGGYVWVNAPELTTKAVINALNQGRFYSSSGPKIYDFYIDDGIAYAKCSPCREIHFINWEFSGRSVVSEHGLISEGEFKLSSRGSYVRIECVDEHGKVAWTNPIFYKL